MNAQDKDFLAVILNEVSQAIDTGDTSNLDLIISNLTPSVSEKYQGVPEGTTHIDLNDNTSSKWIKEEGSFLYFYGDSGHWVPLDDQIHCNMSLREI